MSHPSTAVVTFRDVRHGPWNAHGFALTDLFAEAFDATTLRVADPATYSQQVLASKGKRLDLVRRLPGRSTVRPPVSTLGPTDLLFVVAHDATDLDQLYVTEPDWLESRATKVLVLVEVCQTGDDELRGDLTGGVATHAVGQREQPGTGVYGVLVVGADQTSIAARRVAQYQRHGRSSIAVLPIRTGVARGTRTAVVTFALSRYVPLVDPKSSTYHSEPRCASRAWRVEA